MNKIILSGNLARDPEVRYTQSGKAIATFSLAVSRGWRSKNDTQQQQPTADFFNIVAWDKLGEFCGKYLAKGRKVFLEGRLQSRSYEAQDGTKRYITEVIANEIEFASSKRQDNGGGYEFGNENNSRPQNFNDGSDMIDNRNSKMPDDIDIPF